ncbi:MAG: hypothetical protein PHW11_09535 [Anaerolineaceae bacterium]|nr:hypothetical protein [Anaerolineaceae bacterium]MDD4577494.1 hypothetical protein [Anaerolineaceae bacterium]
MRPPVNSRARRGRRHDRAGLEPAHSFVNNIRRFDFMLGEDAGTIGRVWNPPLRL